jgi:hypothetical protein
MTVDDLPRKRDNPLAFFDATGAAGIGSPRIDVRTLSIDDRVRRARSEPPQLESTRATQTLSMQAFGILAGIDTPGRFRRRALSPEFTPAARDQVAKMGAIYGDIERITAKKHFRSSSMEALMSPRLVAKAIESIDIDAQTGRAKLLDKKAALGILPDSASFEMDTTTQTTFGQSRRSKNLCYYEKTLEAERYAKLIGRPQSQPRTEFSWPQSALKIENLQQRERGWQYNFAVKDGHEQLMAACDWSTCDGSEPNSPVASANVRDRIFKSLSVISTAASEEGEWSGSVKSGRSWREREKEQSLSKASRSIFTGLKESDLKAVAMGLVNEDNADGYDYDHSTKVPLGVRRIVSSMLPNTDAMTESMASELQAAIVGSMSKLVKPKSVPMKSKTQGLTVNTKGLRAGVQKAEAEQCIPNNQRKQKFAFDAKDSKIPVAVAPVLEVAIAG